MKLPLLGALQSLLPPLTLTFLLAINGCSDSASPDALLAPPGTTIPALPAPPGTTSPGVAPPEGRVGGEAPFTEPAVPAAVPAAVPVGRFSELVTGLSEPDGDFISDNLISNETSYLQVADELAARREGGAYIGVGPEQNFTYIALSRPQVAFIVDIRRGNMLQHLYFKALFDEARSRSHFLALLLGRPHEGEGDPGAGADLEAVIAHAERRAPDERTLTATFEGALGRIEQGYGVPLNAKDRKTLEVIARRFQEQQLGIRFELHVSSGRRYPSLRELLVQADPGGARRGFLASEEAFRLVQRMQREHRIIPVVGDFERVLGAPVLLVGFGLPGENAHAPNEWMLVDNFHLGAEAIARMYDELR